MEFPAALREAQYRNYFLANMFSLNAIWGQRTIVAWLAWDLTGSAAWVGLIAFLNFVPTMISGPIFGALADRIDLRRSALAVQLSEMAITGALLALYVGGVLDIYVLAAVSLVFGVVISAHHPTRMALTPRLVPKAALANAVAISSLNFNFARLIGPAAAGWSIATLGVSWTLGACVVLFAPVIMILSTLNPRGAEGPPRKQTSLITAVVEGARFAAGHGLIRAAMTLTGVFALIVRGMLELLPAIADGVFARGAAGLGEMMAAAGAGALMAAIFLSSRGSDDGVSLPPRALIAIFVGFTAAISLAAAPTWPLALTAERSAGVRPPPPEPEVSPPPGVSAKHAPKPRTWLTDVKDCVLMLAWATPIALLLAASPWTTPFAWVPLGLINGVIWLGIPMDRRGYELDERLRVAHHNSGFVVGFGLGYGLGHAVPLLNLLLLTPAAAVGATTGYYRCVKDRWTELAPTRSQPPHH